MNPGVLFIQKFLFKLALAIIDSNGSSGDIKQFTKIYGKIMWWAIVQKVTPNTCYFEATQALMLWQIYNPYFKDECAEIAKLNQTL